MPFPTRFSPYGAAKFASEKMCEVYHRLTGMDINVIRPFTVYGPRQRPDMAIFKFTRMIDQGLSIPLFGDGSTARDYTYISDFVDGIERALGYSRGFRIFNIGGAKSTRLIDLVETISDCLGKPADIDHQPTQPGDVPLTLADITRARTDLGYEPQTPLREGIAMFVDWYRTATAEGRA